MDLIQSTQNRVESVEVGNSVYSIADKQAREAVETLNTQTQDLSSKTQNLEGRVEALESSGGGDYTLTFTKEQWETVDEDDLPGEDGVVKPKAKNWTITIPYATHKLDGDTVVCHAYAKIDGSYVSGRWGTVCTSASLDSSKNLVLHYLGLEAYEGAAVISPISING